MDFKGYFLSVKDATLALFILSHRPTPGQLCFVNPEEAC